jgi:hypothetical protein
MGRRDAGSSGPGCHRRTSELHGYYSFRDSSPVLPGTPPEKRERRLTFPGLPALHFFTETVFFFARNGLFYRSVCKKRPKSVDAPE